MSVSTSDLEERVLTLEREIWRLPDLNERRIRLAAFEQQIQKLFMSFPQSGPPTANTTIRGTVKGCGGYVEPGATVVLNPGGAGNETATVTTDSSGFYSGAIYLAASSNVPIRVTSSDSGYATYNGSVPTGPGGVVTVNVTLTPATGYHCLIAPSCHRPLVNTLTFTTTQAGYTSPRTMTPGGGPPGDGVDCWINFGSSSTPFYVYMEAGTLRLKGYFGGTTYAELGTLTSLSCRPFNAVWTGGGGTFNVFE